ncbi:hypothetical protein AJ78_07804 [Emergomyces pasteurianus Ep9510]|uniref:UDP-N-acetylglucosamine transferase subunit ALG14 n=1 Tax=Emergomyces pasteurianus Ep9510 TaxID=1447872 RepID=A0A1J9Q8B7_9EURO|nr:hypothetical protein AJ78_07804 [Emergomyces pasteurianus Ep9510]
MALATLVLIALTTSAISIWLATCYYYYRTSLNHGLNNNNKRANRESTYRSSHLLIVLGSGGHTTEMLSMLDRAHLDPNIYTRRTYVVSSGDSFSALKAADFEKRLLEQRKHPLSSPATATAATSKGGAIQLPSSTPQQESNEASRKAPSEISQSSYTIVTVPRARKVHQSFLTAPISTLHCLWVCMCVLLGKYSDQMPKKGEDLPSSSPGSSSSRPPPPALYPDIILTNGPATAVCVVLAAKILRAISLFSEFPFFFPKRHRPPQHAPFHPPRERYLRTIFIESWARVTTLSLSGKIVLPLVDRFLVQWDGLEGYSSWLGGKAEFVGALVA